MINFAGENLPHELHDNNVAGTNKDGAGIGDVVQQEQVAPLHIQVTLLHFLIVRLLVPIP